MVIRIKEIIMSPKFTKLMTLLGLVAHDSVKLGLKGRRITVKIIVAKIVVSTWIVTDEVTWEVK